MNTKTRHEIKSFGLSLFLSLGLCSCSNYEESFSTTPGKGSGWKSMSKTYALEDSSHNEAVKKTLQENPVEIQHDVEDSHLCDDQAFIERAPEEMLKIWFAPYQDNHGNLYEASVMRTIVKKGAWVIKQKVGSAL